MFNDYQLGGKVALVTGVGRCSGIGAAVAGALASCGVNVYTTYNSAYDADVNGCAQPEGPAIVEQLRTCGGHAAGIDADLADIAVPAILFDRCEEAIGSVDILVNNAAVDITPTDLFTVTPELMDRHYAVNLRATLLMSREFGVRHDGRPGGRVINLTSGQGLQPMPDNLPYAITKAGIECLTSCLSVSLAPKKITVNAVDPGATDTGWMTPDFKARLASSTVQQRVGLPEDAARLILFLASAQAQWITGQTLRSRGAFE